MATDLMTTDDPTALFQHPAEVAAGVFQGNPSRQPEAGRSRAVVFRTRGAAGALLLLKMGCS